MSGWGFLAVAKRKTYELTDAVKREIRGAGRDGKKRVSVKNGKQTMDFNLAIDKQRKQVIFQGQSGFPVGRLYLRSW